ncbi:FPR2 [Symbiodinium natans]|uniref:peptidylprolyl isomerase n=1 Tax=Symbiodinium natans TaxID=878477 RepID=A0A812JDL7_9DINO|nr:FPR2 [Symbiodinium natans]
MLCLVCPQAKEGFTETSSGLQYKVLQEGSGENPTTGQMIAADYTGWLEDFESDKKFDSSRDRRQPLKFQVGIGKVIKGWDEALLDMKVGERRQIVVPPSLGYGSRSIGPIPAGSTLYFDVELKSIGAR